MQSRGKELSSVEWIGQGKGGQAKTLKFCTGEIGGGYRRGGATIGDDQRDAGGILGVFLLVSPSSPTVVVERPAACGT